MRESLRTLLANVIDYAGLFPPAKLPLDEAIRNYARHRDEPEGWMLGRFVLPAARLAELAPFHDELFARGHPFVFAVLGRGGNTPAEFLDGLRQDLGDVSAFRGRHGLHVIVDVYEARVPAAVLGKAHHDAAVKLLADAASLIEGDGSPSMKPFFECPLRADWREETEAFLTALAEDAKWGFAQHRHRSLHPGFKLRCGGVDKSAFPAPPQVAYVLAAARAHAVPLKLTAGLHHPIHRHDEHLDVMMHGFLNVLVAAVLGATHHLGAETLCEILETTELDLFSFGNTWVKWMDLSADEGEIGACRHNVLQSFGSCSFDEPRDDLRVLGLL